MAPGKPVKKGMLVPLLIISGYDSVLILENNLAGFVGLHNFRSAPPEL